MGRPESQSSCSGLTTLAGKNAISQFASLVTYSGASWKKNA
jgi:hypothetical protein